MPSWHSCAKPPNKSAKNMEEKKGDCRADDVQKKIVLGNSKTLIFTAKISKSIRRHNAGHFLEISECRLYHGCLRVVHHVVVVVVVVQRGVV